jgi:PAS domain S-box-containing protein
MARLADALPPHDHALHLSEERYKILADTLSDAIYDWDLLTDTVSWSDALYREFRYAPGSIEAPSQWWVDRIHPEDRGRVLAEVAALFRTGQTRWEAEYRFQYGDGTYSRVIDRGAAMYNEQGQATRMVGGMTDVTEQRRLAEELRVAQKMEAVGQLAAGIAHDFNNVLTAILGYANLIRDSLTDPRLLEELSEIELAGQRAASLTRQLLAFGRQQVLQVTVLDVNTVITNLGRMLERLIGEHIQIEHRLSPRLPPVRADLGQLEQVVINLAVNARDAMADGGVLIIATDAIDVRAGHADGPLPPGPYVKISVQDSGTGMDEETLQRIFEPFFTTKVRGQGTGLGLATVYGIVRQSGGHLRVSSRIGAGSRFDIWFPSVAPATLPPSDRRVEAGAAHRPERGTTVLLVEDETPVRQLVAEVLRRSGYTVIEARDGHEGINCVGVHAGTIDLLLTDVVMPGVSGLAVAKALATTGSAAPVLFMSGYSEEFAAGTQDLNLPLLQKPFTPARLVEAVRRALDLRPS